jgi:hypothetical protein
MKLNLTVLFCFLGLVSTTVIAQDTKTYTSDSLQFSIDVPQNWQLIENYNNQAALVAIAPRTDATDDFSENVNVIVDLTDLTGVTTDYYRDLSAEGIKAALTANIDSITTDTLPNGLVAGIIHYTHNTNDFSLKVITYLFIIENKGYVITCTAKKEDFADNLALFTKICSTFSFIKPLPKN